MILNLEPSSAREMLRAWVSAEAAARERFGELGGFVSSALIEKLNTAPETLTDAEWLLLEQGICEMRAPLLAGLLAFRPVWYRGTLAVSDVAELRIVELPHFVAVAPDRRFGRLVSWMEAGRAIPGADLLANVERMRGSFDLAVMKGCPILVSERAEGPYVLVEGYTRCSTLLLKHREGSTLPDCAVHVFLGVTSQLCRWGCNGHLWVGGRPVAE